MTYALKLPLLLALLLVAYGALFMQQDQRGTDTTADLSPALPTAMLDVLGHSYMNQLIAEALFIKAAVYLGGLSEQPDEANLAMMQQHFVAMTRLHPAFLDTYYRSESVLAHRGDDYALATNSILQSGRRALPDEVTIPFFEGFNNFHYLNDPVKAAEVLRIASEIEGAPQWIGHLASMLMAKGGNIRTGLVWLKGMLATTQDENEKARYRKDIAAFEKGMQVQQALERYALKHGAYPDNLSALLPNQLRKLPTLEKNYELEYQAPELFLHRKVHD